MAEGDFYLDQEAQEFKDLINGLETAASRITAAEEDIDDLQGDVASLNQSLAPSSLSYTITAGTNVYLREAVVYRSGNVIHIALYFDANAQLSNNAVIATINGSLPRPVTRYATANVHGVAEQQGMISLESANIDRGFLAWGTIPQAQYYYAQFCYITRD